MVEKLNANDLLMVFGGKDTAEEEYIIIVINGKEYVILPNGQLIPLEEY
ncbi:hypothetical protein [Porphyromonas levii]|nr:hypothetical protein [Porphyromonas levii]MBR8730532.1 hypothetical protein [Porphyromonas levii]MBR8785625.1 hypothetical protein [Porphyromonas levii]MBR8803628.1 hypothetical protein [Porphyromonas levii]